jgi:beta-lactam-binding protein with PASTA domain
MRTCQSCGKENPPDQDFCSCGEYLRWEPTGFMQAVTPEALKQAAAEAPPETPPAPPPPAQVSEAAPPPPPESGNGGNGHGAPAAPPPPPAAAPPPPPPRNTMPVPVSPPPSSEPAPIPKIAKTLTHGAVPPPGSPVPAEASDPATIVLRLPEGDPAKGEVLHQAVEPGQRERVLALVRNQSGIVDNYDLAIEGMPDDWWSIFPGTVYLVPFGSGGTYEQEVEVHLHPPKTPEAEAKMWDLRVVAHSKAKGGVEAASAPLGLHILPYIEYATTLRPQRKKGRRKADFDVTVTNKANAPVLVALEGEDPDGELQFGFNRPPQEIPPGGAVKSSMRVRPPKQIWIGRAQDRRLEVKTITGDEAAARAAADPLSADVLQQQPTWRRKGLFRKVPEMPGVYGPRVYRPQLYPPDAQIGPGGIQLRMPKLQKPQLQGPQMKSFNASQLKPGQLKLPGGGGSAPIGPLLPTQGVFRQKPWIPWWAVPLLIAIIALLLLLYKLSPQKDVVPNVVGQPSAFKAEEKLTAANFKLDPEQKEQEDTKHKPGTIIGQTPKAGTKAEKKSPVTVLVAVGPANAKVNVPDITKKTAGDAEKALREKELTLGQASPQPIDPKALIQTQIPAAGEPVKRGTPVDIFYADPSEKKDGDKKGGKEGGKDGGKQGGAQTGGDAAAAITVPPLQPKVDDFAKAAANLGLVPETVKIFDDAPKGTLVRTDPAAGEKAKKGDHVTLFVSAGQPKVLFTNGKDIKLADGRNGKLFDPVADGPQTESDPTWSDDGTHVAYIADGRVTLKDITKKNSNPVSLTPATDKYDNLAWAPIADKNVLAMTKITANDSDLCLAEITKDPTIDPQCFVEPDFRAGLAIHWGPKGRFITAVGLQNNPPQGQVPGIGIVRWKLKKDAKPYSADPGDYGKGTFITTTSKPGKGVIDAAVSPDGQKLALVSNFESSSFRLWIADDPKDFLLANATITPVRACKVNWRGDSKELVVIQSDAGCQEDVGTLARVPVDDVRHPETINPSADDPSYQPFNLGG